MNKLLLFAIFSFLFLAACTGKKKPAVSITETDKTVWGDTIAEAIESTDSTFEIIPQEPPYPIKKMEVFDDFIYWFASDSLFQVNRIAFPLQYTQNDVVEYMNKSSWKHDSLFIAQGYYSLLLESERELEQTGTDTLTSVQVEWIGLKDNSVKKYYFEQVNGRWRLQKITSNPIRKSHMASFIRFLGEFANDTVYQATHIRKPLLFITTDPDDDFSVIESTLDIAQWFAFRPGLPENNISNMIYGEESHVDSRIKILQLKGVGNDFVNTLFFRLKPNGEWELYKFEDASN